MDITINLEKKTDNEGRNWLEARYDQNDLNALCLALLCDNDLRSAAILATAMIMAQDEDPDEFMKDLRKKAEMIKNDKEHQSYNLKNI